MPPRFQCSNRSLTRRRFLQRGVVAASGAVLAAPSLKGFAQVLSERLPGAESVTVLNPRHRVPVGLIIDDSTCLVNLNRFAMPQFEAASATNRLRKNPVYQRNWREWPVEIPDSFVRKFGEWCAGMDVKGKYSVVPFPACVGRIDRLLPGWTQRELTDSIDLVRTLLMGNWDIAPEMCTHTRVIDTKTGHPFPEISSKFMEIWEWTTGRSVDELADYMSYALGILKNVGLHCDGVSAPGGFGGRVLPEMGLATTEAVRAVFGTEVPYYFHGRITTGNESVSPRVECVSGLDGPDPRCVVRIIDCTEDWTGGWDCTIPGGADKFITEDLRGGRMVEVITRDEPALIMAHWTGFYWNGQELGFKVFQEVVRRLHARFDNLIWMKLSELSRYWAAKELTHLERAENIVKLHAPFACPDFTLRLALGTQAPPKLRVGAEAKPLAEVVSALKLQLGTWCHDGDTTLARFALPKGGSQIELG